MYKLRRGNKHRVIIENRTFWVDSDMEEVFIRKLIKDGFSGRWRRSKFGIGFGKARYTPDLELSVLHDDMNRRALVEFKPISATQFSDDRRQAMLAASHFYKDTICLLYVKKTGMWFQLEPNGRLHEFALPTPGGVAVSELSRPKVAVPIVNRYGRIYFVRPGNFVLKKAADGIEFLIKVIASPSSRRRKKRS